MSATQRLLSEEYRGLNGGHIEVFDHPPSALEFSRLVHISRPVVFKGFDIPALRRWSNQYLNEQMGERLVSVATTPDGRADALSRGPDDKLYFAEPFVEKMTIGDLIKHLEESESVDGEVRYLQSQNGNLFSSDVFDRSNDDADSPSEFEPLRSDVPSEIPWCTEALGKRPDAVNIWIGNSRSTTSIHSDPYENIYAVVRGEKKFLLLPPTDGWCLQERSYPHASYTRRSPSSSLELVPSGPDVPLVPWASIIDPDLPCVLPSDVTPIYLTLKPGEVLYLPVGWWHHVRQAGDITISLNWWYDAEMRVAPSVALGEHELSSSGNVALNILNESV